MYVRKTSMQKLRCGLRGRTARMETKVIEDASLTNKEFLLLIQNLLLKCLKLGLELLHGESIHFVEELLDAVLRNERFLRMLNWLSYLLILRLGCCSSARARGLAPSWKLVNSSSEQISLSIRLSSGAIKGPAFLEDGVFTHFPRFLKNPIAEMISLPSFQVST